MCASMVSELNELSIDPMLGYKEGGENGGDLIPTKQPERGI
jgi:hypothetical protein